MGKIASAAELAELLGQIKAPAEHRHPFKEYTYDELTNAPTKVYLCGDDDRPVLLTDALWQTMGLLKSGKTYFCMELGFCIAFGLCWRSARNIKMNSGSSSVFPRATATSPVP